MNSSSYLPYSSYYGIILWNLAGFFIHFDFSLMPLFTNEFSLFPTTTFAWIQVLFCAILCLSWKLLSYTETLPCISSIELEGDKSDIPLLSKMISPSNCVIVTWLLWANHSPGFSCTNTILAGKSWAVIGSNQSHDNNKQNGAKKKNKMSEICNFQAVIG